MGQITRETCRCILESFKNEEPGGFPLTSWEKVQLATAWLEREDRREGEPQSDEAEFEIHGADGVMLVGTSGGREEAWAELMRYAAQYDASEGPLTFYEVTRRQVFSPSEGAKRGME